MSTSESQLTEYEMGVEGELSDTNTEADWSVCVKGVL
jgi:hypothetical protein